MAGRFASSITARTFVAHDWSGSRSHWSTLWNAAQLKTTSGWCSSNARSIEAGSSMSSSACDERDRVVAEQRDEVGGELAAAARDQRPHRTVSKRSSDGLSSFISSSHRML